MIVFCCVFPASNKARDDDDDDDDDDKDDALVKRCCCWCHVYEGELIEIRTRTHTQQDWWEGTGRDGRLGIFPANYVRLL